jgi:hypothetical protein
MKTSGDVIKHFFWSAFFYFFAVVTVFILLRLDGGRLLKLLTWVSSSANPDLGMVCLAVLVVSLIWIILSMQVIKEIDFWGWKVQIDTIKPSPFNYLFNLPLFMLFAFAAVAVVLLFFIPPACEVPSVIFTARVGDNEARQFTPDSTFDVDGSGSVIVFVQGYPTQEGNLNSFQNELSCDIRASGPSVERIDIPNRLSCSSTIFLKKNVPGDILLTASVNGKYCPFSSIYPLNIRVR